jgi:hypothetical protein
MKVMKVPSTKNQTNPNDPNSKFQTNVPVVVIYDGIMTD